MNKKYLKISVITPSFNQGSFIKETIDSVLNQNYPNIEYIVMDGGSTDNTIKILKSYGDKIKWISKKDNGQADAINKGMTKVTGDIITYINSDDVMLPNTLKIINKYFLKHPKAMWLTGDYFIIDEKGNKIQSIITTYKRLLRKYSTKNMLLIANYIIQPSTFWRHSLIKEIGFFDESLHYCLDFDYWMRVINKFKLHTLPNHFSFFRIHDKSKGGVLYKKQFEEEHKLVMEYTNNLFIRILHWLHYKLIILIYSMIK